MLKKVVIAIVAVAAGVAVLAVFCPEVYRYFSQKVEDAKQAAVSAIPLEDRINTLKKELTDLKNNKTKYYDQAAKVSVEVDQLTADVARASADLQTQWTKIDALRGDLDTQKVSFRYNGQDFTRAEVEKDLKQKFAAYKTAEGALDSQKDLLSAKKEALQASRDQLASLESQNTEMEARLETMRADLQRVRMREAKSGLKSSDDEYAKLKSEMDEVGGKIAEREKALDLHAEFDKGAINPLPDNSAEDGDILKQIDAYKAAKNGEPKTAVADNPKP